MWKENCNFFPQNVKSDQSLSKSKLLDNNFMAVVNKAALCCVELELLVSDSKVVLVHEN